MLEFSKLTQDQQRKLLDRLTIHAERKYKRLGWYNDNRYRIPSGQGPDDVAAEAIIRLVEGKRNFNEDKYPDLLTFLRSVVDSIVSHIIESTEFVKQKSMPHVLTEDGEIEEIELVSEIDDPSTIYIKKDLVEKINIILQEKFAQDEIVLGIIECIEAGIYNRSEVIEYLEVKTKDFDNANKRLKREFDKIKSTLINKELI
ncbi:MAG: hypothetical protein FVQ82_08150 [Planctomycetes bacterium]|nr:hypothetical protein [Planctomycetota bacterium]